MSEQQVVDADVIIIGAGPIGLTLANALLHHRVSFRLFEERAKPNEYSKANNLWARTQELHASIGTISAMTENAYKIDRINVLLDGQPLDQVAIDKVASPYPKPLYTGQDVIETALAAALTGGRGVERGRKVVAIEQDADGVSISVAQVNEQGQIEGEAEELRCLYLVGADGIKGITRKAAALEFKPKTMEKRATIQMDARLKWRRSTDFDQLWFFTYHEGFAGVMPVWGGYHRLFFLENDEILPEREPTLEEIQAKARKVAGDDTLTLSDPIWASYGTFKHGVSPSYSNKRIFLAGDAGHDTLPIGGQGMNAGMSDSIGLAWRLAMQLAGVAGSQILDSYSQERQAEHARLDADQTSGFRHLLYRNRIEDAVLGLAGKAVPNLGSKLFGSNDLQQLSVHYAKSPLSEDHLELRQVLQRDVPQAGDRAPDAAVIAASGHSTSVFTHIYNPDGYTWGWSLLGFDGWDPNATAELLAAVSVVSDWGFIRPRLVLTAARHSEEIPDHVVCLFDLDGNAHSAYGFAQLPALVVIRPDGYIAFRGSSKQPELLESFCSRVFGSRQ